MNGVFIMKTMKRTQSENNQAILDERKWTKEYKEAYENLIEKYNDKSWKWIPNGFREDFVKVMRIKWGKYNRKYLPNSEYFQKRLRQRTGLDIFFEIEKNITNPYFFWSIVNEEYSHVDFNQTVLLEWLDAYTRYDRMKLTLEQRQKCVENMIEYKTGESPKTDNYKLWKTLKDKDEVIVYRGCSIPDKSNVRVGRKKINNPQSHKQDSGIGFSYTLDRRCAEYFANMCSIKDGEIWFCGYDKVSSTIPTFIDSDCINETSKKVITRHSVKKENILFYTNDGGEQEIVVLPDTLDLLDYELVRPSTIKHPSDNVGSMEEVIKVIENNDLLKKSFVDFMENNDLVKTLEKHNDLVKTLEKLNMN